MFHSDRQLHIHSTEFFDVSYLDQECSVCIWPAVPSKYVFPSHALKRTSSIIINNVVNNIVNILLIQRIRLCKIKFVNHLTLSNTSEWRHNCFLAHWPSDVFGARKYDPHNNFKHCKWRFHIVVRIKVQRSR